MSLKSFLWLFALLPTHSVLLAQEQHPFTVSFYNVENLFDIQDDPRKRDDEFTPKGKKRWSKTRFYAKLSDLSQVIRSIGGENPPDVIGLAEVENRYVLESLIHQDALKKHTYEVLHKDSPDRRGIDVALLYRPATFQLLGSCTIPILSQEDSLRLVTRDIRYACGIVRQTGDTLHLFVNHFPSRWGGKRQSAHKRKQVAQKLKQELRWCMAKHPDAQVIVMGDFNDTPEDESIRQTLEAVPLSQYRLDSLPRAALVNLSQDTLTPGSYIYRSSWEQLDQIITSPALLRAYDCRFSNFNTPTLFEPSRNRLAKNIRRTYHGLRYHGGVSDHLPVRLLLTPKK